MKSLLAIAWLQLQENLRRQVHLVTLFMAFAMLMLPAYVNAFSMGLQAFELVAKDFGLTLLSYYGVGMALMLGSSIVPRDLERKTIYPILSRPLGRFTYLAGQFLGAVLLLEVSLLLLAGALCLGIASLSKNFEVGLFAAALSYGLECALLIASCMCFSTMASPPLAGVMGFFIYVVGGMSASFIQFFLREDRGSPILARGVEQLQNFLPGFDVFHIKYPVVHGFAINPSYYLAECLYATGWIGLFLMLATLRFERKDL